MRRRCLIAGNWKMHKTISDSVTLARAISGGMADGVEVDMVICPPFTALSAVADVIKGTPVGLGAQNVHWEEKGAYTGEIAPVMLQDAGCRYAIVGHSERRQFFGESDQTVNQRAKAALKAGLIPIICVGETLQQREAGNTDQIVKTQVRGAYAGIDPQAALNTVIAYEPVWAIGTGKASNGPDADRVSGLIRNEMAALVGKETAEQIRILYGGSVKPENMAEFASQRNIDGALVGGASLDAQSFLAIAANAVKASVDKTE
ncbi:MAG TPA: triose-phosphate isomerase [Firmicutes bacterium]|nr:triose-phosphate isomerase [Bacillota bacterium]HAW72020.1 triose-phosphate isomerase [Bacillota bacterium]HAZ23114.1 triose-phosphate isomerase [Bacillota bacterium]HBE06730.1 triose-phosphate isomerase [Bacillota bacterium]HBG44126.1 triose-phosphate isomerase [Bacillota bacterium]